MNYIDIIIIVLLVISAIRGAVKGFIYEITSLIALIAGVWGAIELSGASETFLIEKLNLNNNYVHIIAFVVTFLLIIILVHFIGKAVEKAIETIKLNFINRLLGFGFALLKSAFILGIVLVLIGKVNETIPVIPEKHVQESALYAPLRGVVINTFPFIQSFFEEVKEKKKYFDGPDEESTKVANHSLVMIKFIPQII
ncbi:MAG TPA: CvpA family protein [Prolixibacteraceae bacterium]|nr:CvpA family protein [Prolixibacteraceae bacterium]